MQRGTKKEGTTAALLLLVEKFKAVVFLFIFNLLIVYSQKSSLQGLVPFSITVKEKKIMFFINQVLCLSIH